MNLLFFAKFYMALLGGFCFEEESSEFSSIGILNLNKIEYFNWLPVFSINAKMVSHGINAIFALPAIYNLCAFSVSMGYYAKIFLYWRLHRQDLEWSKKNKTAL